MKQITAYCYLACGIALILKQPQFRWAETLIGGIVCLIGGFLTFDAIVRTYLDTSAPHFVEYILSFLQPPNQRVTLPAAASLLLCGAGLFLHRTFTIAPALAALGIAILNCLVLASLIVPSVSSLIETQSIPAAISGWFLAFGLLSKSGIALRTVTLRMALLTLVICAILPTSLVTESQVRRNELDRRSALELRTAEIAAQGAGLLDRIVAERTAILKTLAESPQLKGGDLSSFYRHAAAVASLPESVIVLTDASLEMLLSTARPYGTPLPKVVDEETVRRALATRRVAVSDLYNAPFSSRAVVSVAYPVEGTGYVLRITATSEWLSEQLRAISPRGWVLSAVDTNGVIIARGQNSADWVGKSVPPQRFRDLRSGLSGSSRSRGLDGRLGYASFRRSLSGWYAVAVIDEATLVNLSYGGRTYVSFAWLLVSAIGVVFAILTAIAIGRSLARLMTMAERIGKGEVPPPLRSTIREIDDLAATMHQAAKTRHDRELALQEKSHLESLGRLTGGIAHDFNNLLTIIGGHIQLLSRQSLDAAGRTSITEATQAIDISARLNQRLMSFARQRPLAAVPIDINMAVQSVIGLVRSTSGRRIEVVLDLKAAPATVRADVSELESMFINLSLNARDAMPNGGKLTINTGNEFVGEDDPRQANDLPAGGYVRIGLKDTGAGMSEDVKSRAFEPFFTTKEPGQGTGLGLTAIYGFVKQSGGYISINSQLGIGTEVVVLLPEYSSSCKHEETSEHAQSAERRTDLPKLLLVDDDNSVRRTIAAMIRQLGYDVVEASRPLAALEVLANDRAIDLVMSDIVMPGPMTGYDLADRLSLDRPELKVILITGQIYSLEQSEGAASRRRILEKPFSLSALDAAIKNAIG